MKKEQIIVFVDEGHGGIDPNKKHLPPPQDYTSFYTVQGKYYDHSRKGELQTLNGKPLPFHNKGFFYEGVSNRTLGLLLKWRIAERLPEIKVVSTAHEWQDTPLKQRVEIANIEHAKSMQQVRTRSLFVSLHSNAASDTSAVGQCVFTSIGQTASDKVAEYLLSLLKLTFKDHKTSKDTLSLRYRTDDGDLDHEENFYVLSKTNMPAILLEYGFFTNLAEAARIMYDKDAQAKLIEAIVDTIEAWVKNAL